MKYLKNIRYRLGTAVCIAAAGIFSLIPSGCLKDDSPLPNDVAEFTSFTIRGQISSRISPNENKVYVDLADSVDITHAYVTNVAYNYDNTTASPDLEEGSYLDLSSDKVFTLTTYKSYEWTIVTTQTVERQFSVENQYGLATFDETAHTVSVKVAPGQPLNSIKVLSAKFANEGSTVTPDPKTVTDFSSPVAFTVTFRGVTQKWTVTVEHSAVSLEVVSTNVYAKHIDVEGYFTVGADEVMFQYKKASASSWIDFKDVTVNSGDAVATINNLEPETAYQLRIVAVENLGAETSETVSFTTESAPTLENMGFDNWYRDGNTWYPNIDLSDAHYIWDSGNKGENSLGEKNPTSPEETIVVSGKAAKLQSISIVSVFAAGNLFTGHYVSTSGLSAKLSFGIPFTGRPQRLKGHYNYAPGTIDKTDSPYDEYKGKPDTCQIYILLTDWTEPFIANSATKTFIDYDNDPSIIARGQILDGSNTGGYKEFNIKLEYLSKTRIPKYILIVATSSRRGDYFTGSTSSVLYVDEFSLVYE